MRHEGTNISPSEFVTVHKVHIYGTFQFFPHGLCASLAQVFAQVEQKMTPKGLARGSLRGKQISYSH